MTQGEVLVGTASWSDPGFVEYWYPPKMPASDRLSWYAQHFNTVEINSTFYSVPEPRLVERWCESTPDDFTFDVKLHQLLSRHATTAKLLPPSLQKEFALQKQEKVECTAEMEAEMIDAFRPALQLLRREGKLGVLLLQLSPAFSPRKHELVELEHVLDLLSDYSVAIELRNRNWARPEQMPQTLTFFRQHKAIFVNVDAPPGDHFTIMPSDIDAITDNRAAYLRLHGRDPAAYIRGKTVAARFNYDYSQSEIEEVAARSRKLARSAREVHVIFNNNARDYAPHAALRLRKALGQITATPPRTQELF